MSPNRGTIYWAFSQESVRTVRDLRPSTCCSSGGVELLIRRPNCPAHRTSALAKHSDRWDHRGKDIWNETCGSNNEMPVFRELTLELADNEWWTEFDLHGIRVLDVLNYNTTASPEMHKVEKWYSCNIGQSKKRHWRTTFRLNTSVAWNWMGCRLSISSEGHWMHYIQPNKRKLFQQ